MNKLKSVETLNFIQTPTEISTHLLKPWANLLTEPDYGVFLRIQIACQLSVVQAVDGIMDTPRTPLILPFIADQAISRLSSHASSLINSSVENWFRMVAQPLIHSNISIVAQLSILLITHIIRHSLHLWCWFTKVCLLFYTESLSMGTVNTLHFQSRSDIILNNWQSFSTRHSVSVFMADFQLLEFSSHHYSLVLLLTIMPLLSLFIEVIIFIISPKPFVELELRKAEELLCDHVSSVLNNFLTKLELPEHEQNGR